MGKGARKKSSVFKKIYQALRFFFKLAGLAGKIDHYFQVETFAHSLGKLHFNQQGASSQKKNDFFKKQLSVIEIETHAFCNRTCSFCPNAQNNRLNKSEIMEEALFKKIIDELSALEYQGTVQLHRYNEPLALDLIFDRINYARKKLPSARIGFHSNGDYLTKEKLDLLEGAGLDFITVTLYINFGLDKKILDELAKKQCEDFIGKRNLEARQVSGEGNLIRYLIPMKRMCVYLLVPDVASQWVDRGGAIKSFSKGIRVSPCDSPFRKLLIDWTGDALPCCNLRGDIKAHQPYILGNLKDFTLQEIFYRPVTNELRMHLAGFNEKQGACRACQFSTFVYSKKAEGLINKTLKNLGVKLNEN